MNTIHINMISKKPHHKVSRRFLTSLALVAIVFQSTGGLIPAFAASEPQVTDPQLAETDAINGERVDAAALAQTGSVSPTSVIPVQNPTLTQSCGLDIGLVVDQSGSIERAEMTQLKTALSNFASAFIGTPTVFSLASFSTNSTLNRPFSLTPAQAASAIGTDIPSVGNGWTNWDSGLARSAASFDPRPARSNLIVIATDGSPNRWGYTVTDGTVDHSQALDNAIFRANTIKSSETRIVVVGIGNDANDPATPAEKLNKMKAISGSSVALLPADITVNTDVIKVSDFTGIGAALSSFANQLCGGKILVQKQFDTDGNGTADLDGSLPDSRLAGWNFTVDAQTKTTTDTGALEFDVVNGTYSVTESAGSLNARLTAANCQKNGQDIGTVNLPTKTVSGLPIQTDQTIACTFVNTPLTGSLTVNKKVDADGNGTFEGGNGEANALGFRWGLDGAATNREMGASVVVSAGNHNVTENDIAGYHFTGWFTNGNTQFSCINPEGMSLPVSTSVVSSTDPGAGITLCNARDTAPLTVLKSVDTNGDGVVDISDDPTWTWDLDDGDQNFATGSTQMVTTGVHSVNENNQPNYHNLSWSCVKTHDGTALGSGAGTTLSVTIQQGGATCTFTNSRDSGRIAGTKFNDLNENGYRDADEPGVANVMIALDNGSSTSTDVNGDFSFELLPVGNYTVTEVVPAGWVATTPITLDEVVVTSNHTTTVSFGNFKLGKISGFKYDTNHVALNGWRICITPQYNDSAIRVTTGEDTCVATGTGEWPTGYYEFTNLHAGTYRVYETPQADWVSVSPDASGHTIAIISGTGVGEVPASYDFVNRHLVPDMAVTKTDGLTTANAGQHVSYTLVASNVGEVRADNVTVVDSLPAHVTFVSASNDGVFNSATKTISWNLGSMDNTGPTQSKTLTVTVQLDATFPVGQTVLTNAVDVSTTTPEPNLQNNHAIDTTAVTITPPITSGPTLSITKTSNVTTFTNPGLFVAYTITVTNSATVTETAKNIVLKDVLPAGFTFEDSSTSKTFTAFDLKPGESKTFTVNALVGLVTAGAYTNTSTAKGDNTTQVSASTDVQIRVPEVLGVTAEAQLTLIKQVNTKLTNAGKTIRYAVTVENIGNATAVNVTITDKLPTGFTYVDGGKTTKTFTIGDLPAGQKRSINYEVLVGAKVKQGDYKNVASAQADNVPAVLADATVSVGKPEVLAATGTGPLDYAIAGLGFILAALGIGLFINRRPGENQS